MSTSRRLIALLAPHRLRVALILLGLVVATITGVIGPWVMKQIIDRVINGRDYDLLGIYIFALMANTVVRGFIDIAVGYSREVLGQTILRTLKQRMYDHIQRLPMAWYTKIQTGQLMSRFISDCEQTRVFLAFACVDLFSVAVTFLVAVVFLMKLSWPLALVCLAFMPFLVREVLVFRERIRRAWSAIHQQMAELNARLQESITGIRVVKAFCREDYEARRFRHENRRNYIHQMKANRISSDANPYMDFLGTLSWIALLAFGGWLVIDDRISVGTFVAFNGYLWNLIWPVRHLGWIVNVFGQASAAAERVFEILDARASIASPPDATPSIIKGYVAFEDVTVRIGGRTILDRVSFQTSPGQVVAIVGRTGAGKTTLMNLVSRFLDPTTGTVKIDGIDIKRYDLSSYRSQVGLVFQETFLFSDTLRNNIAYARSDASEDDLNKSIRHAQAYEFISQLEDGLNTEVGERGVGLSGGQKQRVALARAFVKSPRILILDDATSALDLKTERAVFSALTEMMGDKTTFIVAQRLMTIKDADLILVMDKGRIVEHGKHDDLLAANGLYRAIFNEQYNTQSEQLA